jgi:hypothetical protein
MWLNTIAVVLSTAYENLKCYEVPVLLSGQRHGRAELLCLSFLQISEVRCQEKYLLNGTLRYKVAVKDVKVLAHG